MRMVKSLDDLPFVKKGGVVLYLGEIKNMKEHGVYGTQDGKIHFGYHIDRFVEPTNEEL